MREALKISKDATILEGPLLLPIIKLSLPILLSNLAQTLYGLADAFWLGRLSKEAFAATSVTRNVVLFVLSFAMGFSMSATALVAQYKGANRPEEEEVVIAQVLGLFTIFSVIASIICIFSSDLILHAISVPQEIFMDAKRYIVIIYATTPLVFCFMAFQGAYNGHGNTITPMKIQFLTIGINIILDPFLIFGWLGLPSWGVRGAAYGQLISRSLAVIMGFYLLINGPYGLRLRLRNLRPHVQMLKKIIDIGLPSAISFASTQFGFVILNRLINSFGTIVISAYGVGSQINGLFMMPAMGISRGIATTVGQNLGAKNNDRAKKSVYLGLFLALSILGTGTLLMYLVGKQAVMAFLPNEMDVAIEGARFLKFVGFSIILFGIFHVFSGAFGGAGKTKFILFISLIRLWGIYLPLAYFLARNLHWGSVGVYWSMVLSNLLAAIIAYIIFLRGRWLTSVIEDKVLEAEEVEASQTLS